MSDDIDNVDLEEDDAALLAAEELDSLKERCKAVGLSFHPNISYEKLSGRYQEFMDAKKEAEKPAPVAVVDAPVLTKGQAANKMKREQSALIRVRVACMNPNKREWEGEVFTVSNRSVGTLKKYVPYDTVWHVPRMILTMIEERQCQVFVTESDGRGNKSRKGKMVKEFAIEVLPQLTEAQIKDLAQRQAMAAGTAA